MIFNDVFLENGLGGLATQLENGVRPANISLFDALLGPMTALDVQRIQADITTIKTQLTGARLVQNERASPSAMIIQELGRAA